MTNDDNWLKKCLTCQHCYKRQADDDLYYCRKRNGKCVYKEYKPKGYLRGKEGGENENE